MERYIQDMAGLFVANGYGFGKLWGGYIFGKRAKDEHFFFLSANRMAILSAGIDEDGEKTILKAADSFTNEELNEYFSLDYEKKTTIDWLEQPVNVFLLCEKPDEVKNNMIYFMWPAVKLNFTSSIQENTIVVHDRLTPRDSLLELQSEVISRGLDDRCEYWTMLKMLSLSDRFGEFAPKVCMDSIASIRKQ